MALWLWASIRVSELVSAELVFSLVSPCSYGESCPRWVWGLILFCLCAWAFARYHYSFCFCFSFYLALFFIVALYVMLTIWPLCLADWFPSDSHLGALTPFCSLCCFGRWLSDGLRVYMVNYNCGRIDWSWSSLSISCLLLILANGIVIFGINLTCNISLYVPMPHFRGNIHTRGRWM